jgi:hypothetical protein
MNSHTALQAVALVGAVVATLAGAERGVHALAEGLLFRAALLLGGIVVAWTAAVLVVSRLSPVLQSTTLRQSSSPWLILVFGLVIAVVAVVFVVSILQVRAYTPSKGPNRSDVYFVMGILVSIASVLIGDVWK